MALPKRIIKVNSKFIEFLYILKKIQKKETERLLADPAPGISATPHEDNLRYFDVIIAGPDQSPFEGKMTCSNTLMRETFNTFHNKVVYFTWSCFYPKITQWDPPKFVS
jgi:ubiquitin-conjugating enzyme E2 N